MADISLTTDWVSSRQRRRVASALDAVVHRIRVLQRRGRRDRYIARFVDTVGLDRAIDVGIGTRRSQKYPWFEALIRAAGCR